MTVTAHDDDRTALVVVDLRGGFLGTTDHDGVIGSETVVAAVRDWTAHARNRAWPVFWTRDVDPFPVPDGDPDGLLELDPLRAELDDVARWSTRVRGREGASQASSSTTRVLAAAT